MSFFDKLIGKEKEYPPLDSSNPLNLHINNFRNDLEILAKEISDPLEVVLTSDTAYVFMGKPPKKFGMAWIRDGRIKNFTTLAQEEKVHELKLQLMTEKLRKAYENSKQADRFSTSIADHKIVVTSSDALEQDLKEIIKQ